MRGRILWADDRRLGCGDTTRAQLDPQVGQPAPKVAIDRWCAEGDLLVQRPAGRVEDERLGLWAPEPAVRPDELLEGRHLAEHGVVLADDEQVWRVLHGVDTTEAVERVRAERRGRIDPFHAAVHQVARALVADDEAAVVTR